MQATSVFKGGVVTVSLRSQRLQDGHLQQLGCVSIRLVAYLDEQLRQYLYFCTSAPERVARAAIGTSRLTRLLALLVYSVYLLCWYEPERGARAAL